MSGAVWTERRACGLVALLLAGILLPAADALSAPAAGDPRPVALERLPAGVEAVHLEPVPPGEDGDGGYRYVVEHRDGRVEHLGPERFAELLYTEPSGRTRLFALLNITSVAGIAWVGLGFLGQALFSGRMLVQWLASEWSRRSVVPVAFWWLSLAGATMLLVYFIWRKDVVGILGQATGWLIYGRNLRLIYRGRSSGA